jgi:hypothetical protein
MQVAKQLSKPSAVRMEPKLSPVSTLELQNQTLTFLLFLLDPFQQQDQEQAQDLDLQEHCLAREQQLL